MTRSGELSSHFPCVRPGERAHAGNRLHREGEGQRAGNVTSGVTRLDTQPVCTAWT